MPMMSAADVAASDMTTTKAKVGALDSAVEGGREYPPNFEGGSPQG
jgi:hypothetical protein